MLTLLRRNQVTVGLDIGSAAAKLAVIDHSGREPEVCDLAMAALPPDAIVEGEILDARSVAAAVRDLTGRLDGEPRHVVTSVGGRDLIVKKLQLDRVPLEDVGEIVRWEAEQFVPFDMEHVALDFQVLNPAGDELQMDVLLAAAKHELVEQRLGLLREAGLTPRIVDADAFALCNSFTYNYPGSTAGIVLLINVGRELSTVTVLRDGVPVLARDLSFGSRHLCEELRRMHDLGEAEAEEVVLGRSAHQADFAGLLTEACEELAVGVERAVAFLGLGAQDRRPGRAYLCGGGVHVPELPGAIANRLRLRTEVASPFERLRLRPSASVDLPLREVAPMMMLCVGLALRAPG